MHSSSSESLWQQGVSIPTFPSLEEDLQTDVCVVGAGIAGLTTAYFLQKRGMQVIVLERNTVASGETGRTTAHLTNALDDRYYRLEKMHGLELAKRAAESHTAAVDAIEKICIEEKIECDFERIDGYLFLPTDEHKDFLEMELAALKRVGISEAELIHTLPEKTFEAGPCIRFPRQGQFHILKYMTGLANAVRRHGGKIFTKTPVMNAKGDKECTVETAQGHTIRCKAVVLATNAPIIDSVRIYGAQSAYRTFVIAAAVPKGSVHKALYWDTNEPEHPSHPVSYHYMRLLEEKNQDILVIGGEDHRTGQADDAGLRFSRLERFAHAKFPQIREILARWSGQVQEPADGVAMIGRSPAGGKNFFIATGDSGNGMTHGTIAGIMLPDLIAGKKHRWQDLYDPRRVRLKSSKNILRDFTTALTYELKRRRGDRERADPREIAPGSGTVLRRGKEKIAIYRDEEGKIHQFSAVCPHAGCTVQWNSYEKSWDCPCHGSRFDRDGHVLIGPTLEDLKRLDVIAQFKASEKRKNEGAKQKNM